MNINTNGNIAEPMEFMRVLLKWRKYDPAHRSISVGAFNIKEQGVAYGNLHLKFNEVGFHECVAIDNPKDLLRLTEELYDEYNKFMVERSKADANLPRP